MSELPKPNLLPAPVLKVLGQVRAWVRALPPFARVALFTVCGMAVLAGGYAALRPSLESYSVLFSQLERDDAAAIVTKLKELKVPYKIEADGTTVSVPEARVHDVRLELATAGLPHGGGVGFESFDKMRLGATEFEQRVLYRRALEGELARTVGTLAAVQTARVHLVLPEKSVFVARSEPASASIVVKLRPGRSLGPAEVSGVVHLTASSVPSLTPEHITLVTTDGTMLHRPKNEAVTDGSPEDGAIAAQTRAAEVSLEERARAMLERMFGPGHADVRVSAEMDLARVERTEDHYDPARAVLRSEEESQERNGLDDTVAGVPGVESNVPTGAAIGGGAALGGADGGVVAKAATGAGVLRTSHTRNYEIDHVSEKRTRPSGGLKRLTVAVVLDGVNEPIDGHAHMVPRNREELDKVAGLMRGAVGIDMARGDLLTVESVPFVDVVDTDAPLPAPPPIVIPPLLKKHWPIATGAGVLLALLVTGMLLSRRRKAARVTALALAAATKEKLLAGATPILMGAIGSGTAPLDVTISPKLLEITDPRAAAVDRATRDPASAALVLRAWLGTTEIPQSS